MDNEMLRSIFPVLGGILALAGGVFTFVSGRLRDADGTDAKSAVIRRTWEWLASALSVAGFLTIVLSKLYVLGMLLFAAAFILQVYMFLQNSSPLRRVDVVTFGLLCATFVSMLMMAITFSLFERVINIQERMIDFQEKLINGTKTPPNSKQ